MEPEALSLSAHYRHLSMPERQIAALTGRAMLQRERAGLLFCCPQIQNSVSRKNFQGGGGVKIVAYLYLSSLLEQLHEGVHRV